MTDRDRLEYVTETARASAWIRRYAQLCNYLELREQYPDYGPPEPWEDCYEYCYSTAVAFGALCRLLADRTRTCGLRETEDQARFWTHHCQWAVPDPVRLFAGCATACPGLLKATWRTHPCVVCSDLARACCGLPAPDDALAALEAASRG